MNDRPITPPPSALSPMRAADAPPPVDDAAVRRRDEPAAELDKYDESTLVCTD